MKRSILIMLMTLAMAATAAPALASGQMSGHDTQYSKVRQLVDLARLARSTAQYHRLPAALADDYEAFAIPPEVGGHPTTGLPGDPTCFDSSSGGMGVHYVDFANLGDPTVSVTKPEALVYEVLRNGKLRLVGVEYIVPADAVDPANPPMLFGRHFHEHPYLPVYILHVWVWKYNPSGLYADFNPRVGACPS